MNEYKTKHYGLNIELPSADNTKYHNFVHTDTTWGNKEKPTKFEQTLPKDWKTAGYSLGKDPIWSEQSYEFPEHKDGLTAEEIGTITEMAAKLGAIGVGISGIEEKIQADTASQNGKQEVV